MALVNGTACLSQPLPLIVVANDVRRNSYGEATDEKEAGAAWDGERCSRKSPRWERKERDDADAVVHSRLCNGDLSACNDK